jgi:CelD/BcsL family acetyltransferase involved in cellulose biosynthesis
MQIRILESVEALAGVAGAWDDLWQRSEGASPSARADQVALFLAQFAPRSRFRAVIVEEAGRMLAAIPLFGRRVRRLVPVAALPGCEWSSGGDLLLDPACDRAAVLHRVAEGLERQPWPLLWCDEVPQDAPRWRQLGDALVRRGWHVDWRRQGSTGQVVVKGDWAAYEESLGGDFRRARKRYGRRLEQAASTTLHVQRPSDPYECDALVRRVFEVEDRSWKGAAGSSAMKTPGMLDFYQRQARLLAARGQLEIVLLQHGEATIAAAYIWAAKGVRFVAKLGYDEAYRQFGPGQHMIYRYLQRLHSDPDCRVLDFWGPLAPWTASWSNHVYDVGRLVAAPPRLASKGLYLAYTKLRRRRRESPAAAAAELSA